MRDALLDVAEADVLRTTSFSYREVGASRGALPDDYQHVQRDVTVGYGRDCFEAGRTALLGWHLHRSAGFRIVTSTLTVRPDSVAVVRVGLGPLAVRAPVRVVYVVDDINQAGFAYGTLPGHPESGEESFLLTIYPDDRVQFSIVAFSRPGTLLARSSGSLGRALQQRMTDHYVDAMLDYCRPSHHGA
jgi:uncharacterized protein (UPF0548 family)